ncbi:PREDICTED: probable calcium-binding protein CML34 [Brassica oleracea var. oleracea]|uniref:probable calcium-binding protein CML34 n=1 Tax=Brassica oleracea var. oleracea TaxID=109376 RepID=UPI0006A708DB|nr:PREDICTED: probable calcium-binding protein CML34 [Brassica oleracea var. oleracea]
MFVKQIFEKFNNKNKNGKLSLDEFLEAVLAFSLNISEEEVTQMFKEIDVDGDGELSSDEFASSVDKMLKKLFALCDADGDGKITSSEFHAAMIGLGKECTEEKCAEMLKTADVDGDGYLSFEEFMVTIIGEF